MTFRSPGACTTALRSGTARGVTQDAAKLVAGLDVLVERGTIFGRNHDFELRIAARCRALIPRPCNRPVMDPGRRADIRALFDR